MPGLLDTPFTNALYNNSNGLLAAASAINPQSRTLAGAMRPAFGAFAQGKMVDEQMGQVRREEAERQAQMQQEQALRERYTQFFTEQNQPNLARAVADQVYTPADAYDRWMKAQGGDSDETYYGSPIYTTDEAGNLHINQLGNQGSFRPVQLPEGQRIAPPTTTEDTGTEIITYDRFGNELYRTPKENYQEAFETTSGREEATRNAEMIANAPQAITNAENILRSIDNVLSDPMLGQAVGAWGWIPNAPGIPQAGVISKIEQIQGQAFLQAFETLKGGGQITEVEGQKATNAIARLQRSQSEEDFRDALTELRNIVNIGLERARQQAMGIAPQQADWQQPSGNAPEGVDPTTWQYMTPEERALWN